MLLQPSWRSELAFVLIYAHFINVHLYAYAGKPSMFFPNFVHISGCSCVTSTQLSIKLNSISGSWQTIRGMFHGFGLQTNHLCTTKPNMKPRSQNDFPACIFLLLWTRWLTAERWRERKKLKTTQRDLIIILHLIKMSGTLIVFPKARCAYFCVNAARTATPRGRQNSITTAE